MGFRPSCDVAQTTSEMLIDFPLPPDSAAKAYIDNFLFASQSLESLKAMMKTFLERCDAIGLVLNDRDPPITSGDDGYNPEADVLGEHYNAATGKRSLTASALEKLALAVEVTEQQSYDLTARRSIAAVFGILFYASAVFNIKMSKYWHAMKAYRNIAAAASQSAAKLAHSA